MKPGPELDRLVAEKVLGWVPYNPSICRLCLDANVPHWQGPDGEWVCGDSWAFSEQIRAAVSAAEQARAAGKFDAWDVRQFETASASTGRLMPNGRTLAWADAVQGETPAHALALAVLAACGGAV